MDRKSLSTQISVYRRHFLATLGAAAISGLAGCQGEGDGEGQEQTTVGSTTDTAPPTDSGTFPEDQPPYSLLYFDDFESGAPQVFVLSNGATVTETGEDDTQAVTLGSWSRLGTNPEELPLSPDTYYTIEFDYHVLHRGTADNLVQTFLYPAGSNRNEDAIHCRELLGNAETTGRFSTGGLTTDTADAYRFVIQASDGVEIQLDNLAVFRVDPETVDSPPDRWTELSQLPFPRLGNFVTGTTKVLAMSDLVAPDWPAEEPVYQASGIEERLALYDVIAGPYLGIQTWDTAFVKRLRALNPNVVILPYRIPHEFGTEKPRPPHATIDSHFEYIDGLAEEWIVTDSDGDTELDADYPFILKLNYSDFCPVVDGETHTDYFVDSVVSDTLASGIWDGVFFDNLFARINPHIKHFDDPERFDFDINRNGDRDETPAAVSEMAREATLELLERLRNRVGDDALFMGNTGWNPERCTAPYLNGFVFETWMDAWFGIDPDSSVRPDEGAWKRAFDDYRTFQANTRAPHITILEGGGHESGTPASVSEVDRNYLEPTDRDVREHRFGLGTALLSDGFYEYDLHSNVSPPVWFDEYTVDENGNAVEDRQYKGYLGMPLAAAEQLDAVSTPIWEEDFESGRPPTIEGEYAVENGRLVIDMPEHERTTTMAATKPGAIGLEPETTYVVELDWEILETLDYRCALGFSGSAGLLGTYTLPEVIAGESGHVRFHATLDDSGEFAFEIRLDNGGRVAIDSITISEGGVAPWRRDFEHGFVLVNPINEPYTFDSRELAGAFDRRDITRIQGSQAPAVNTGQPVTDSLTLDPFEAIILLAETIEAR